MRPYLMIITSFLLCSSLFATSLSLTVVSYVGKLEYSTMDFGPWRTLEVDDPVPQRGYLRLTSANDSAELLRSDGVIIRLGGNTVVSVESLLNAPKPKQGFTGLFRKKKPIIEIDSEVAVAAVRGSKQGQPPSALKPSQSQPLGIHLGLGGVLSSESSGFLIAMGYTNQNWHISVRAPFLWDKESFFLPPWSSIDGLLSFIHTFRIGSEKELFFLQWDEGTIQLGEGLLVEQNIKRFHPYSYNENILQAQINFGDVGVRALVDRPSDADRWAVEAFIHPFWGANPLLEQLTVRAFIINERDSFSPFYSSHFSPTNGTPSYITGYGVSLFVPLFKGKKWQFALLGEIAGLNELPAYMGGGELCYDTLFTLKGRLVWNTVGIIPWYFHTFYRYTRPQERLSLANQTNTTFSWSLSGRIGNPTTISLSWDIKRQLANRWLGEAGVITGEKLLPWGNLFVGWATYGDDVTPLFSPEHNLSLLRLSFHPNQLFLSVEYAQAMNSWGKGVFSIVGGYKF